LNNIKYIIRKRAMGDVLWIEPVIRALAEKNKQLIVHTKFNSLFENFPYQNVFFKNELSLWEKCLIFFEKKTGLHFFTLNLDEAYEIRPHLHLLNAYQEKAGLPKTSEYPKLYLSAEEQQNRVIRDKYVVLHLESFSSKSYRQIFGVDWHKIVSFFSERGLKVIQIGLNSHPIENTISLKTSLRELISLLYHCEYFIGLDSGPSHIAASFRKPSMIFFGAINPDTRHFRSLFRGFLIKQSCEYDNNYKKIISNEDLPCLLSSDPKIAKCCIYTTDTILLKVNELLKINDTEIHQ
jgi:ADP-heptose:LPS heptosyltransferase